MRAFKLSIAVPRGTLLIGGYSAVPTGLHAVHASDAGGRPIIPSSAIRGALRESLEALLRGSGQDACSGGDGLVPGGPANPEVGREGCRLVEDDRCKACQLFGTQRAAIQAGERSFSALRLSDAVLEQSQTPWRRQPGVALDRRRRGASHQRLFDRRVPALAGHRFIASGDLTSESEEHISLLEAAARTTTHIGSGRSRGMARVDLDIDWQTPESPTIPKIASDTIFVRATLQSPATFSLPQSNDNVRETREEVPGSALRGAVGWALARTLAKPDEDAAFQALVAEDGARFGFLYPVEASASGTSISAASWPITAQTCKLKPTEHGTVDTLLDALSVRSIQTQDQVRAIEEHALTACFCGQPLTRAPGWRSRSAPLSKRMVTRVALDRARASARDGALFSHVLLEPGATFEGRISGIPAASRGRLAEALAEPMFLGRGSSMGWGRMSIEVVDPTRPEPLKRRAERFEEALRARWAESGLPTDGVGQIVPLTLLSPLVPQDSDPDGLRTLAEALGFELEWHLVQRRFVHEGGWDQRLGKMSPCLAVAAGGVFVARLRGTTWRDQLADLERLEAAGAGQRRHQGYGALICFDPFILHRSFQDEPTSDS